MWFLFDWLFWLPQWIWKLWNRLPEKAKREIIQAIIQAMEGILRAYYRSSKSERGK